LKKLASCNRSITEALSLASELNDAHALATARWYTAAVAHFVRNSTRVASVAADLIELSMRHGFTYWLAGGTILHGWARAVSEDVTDGLALIEAGIHERCATGSMLAMPFFLALKAEALHLAGRTSEALDTIREADAFVDQYEERAWCTELHRLRGVFLAGYRRRRASN
jgi:predicted ATPase